MNSVSSDGDHAFRFVTNHGHVLQVVATNPTARLRDIAEMVGITERTAAQIVTDLEQSGYLTKTRVGRRNQYEVHSDAPMRHPASAGHSVGELLSVLSRDPSLLPSQES